MTIDGQEYGQSMSILRSLGAKHDLYFPTDSMTSYYCDVVIDTYTDVFESVAKICLPILTAKGGQADDEDKN